jgi:hypothetical protein
MSLTEQCGHQSVTNYCNNLGEQNRMCRTIKILKKNYLNIGIFYKVARHAPT